MRIRFGLLAAAAMVAAVVACSDDDPRGRGAGGTGGAGGAGGIGGAGGDVSFRFSIDGLTDAVRVTFDAQHVLHLSCRTDEDCAAVLGWFHAQYRFWQMDLFRRVARGRAATLIGAYDLDDDVAFRRFLSTRDGTPIEEAIWATMPDETKAIVEAYARGVNAWLADVRAGRNGASLTEEYRIPIVQGDLDTIPGWDPLDTVAFARLMTWRLSDTSGEEMNAGERFALLEPERAVALFTLAPAARANTYGVSGETYGAPASVARAPARGGFDRKAIEKLQARLARVRGLLAEARAGLPQREILGVRSPDATEGSNNWVLAPGRTAAGKALLANDPHLDLENPAVWFLAHLDAVTDGEGTMNVAGATFPGIPGVPIGRNPHVAWGNTTAYYDVADVYVETLNAAGDAVLFDGDGDGTLEEVPIVRKEVTFARADGEAITATLEWVPHHGPIVGKNPGERTAVTVRWTGHEATDELTAFLRLSRATSVAEAREALRIFGVGAQNFLLVDTAGHIGWWPRANVPRRPWASFDQANPIDPAGGSLPPWLPLPGDGSAEWAGYLSDEELPQIWDPASGVIATANQPMTAALDDGDPTNDGIPVLQSGAAHGFRMQRIADLLAAGGDAHTPETMHAIQADTHSLPGEAVVPAVLAGYREQGVLRRLSVTPVSPATVLIAQLLVNLALAVVSSAVLVVLGRIAFGIPLPRHLLGFLAAFLVGVAALLAIGTLLAAIAPTTRAATALGMIGFVVVLFLGGVYLPRVLLPDAIARLGAYAPPGVQAVFDGWLGTAPPDPVHLLVMAGIAVVAAAAAARLFRWE